MSKFRTAARATLLAGTTVVAAGALASSAAAATASIDLTCDVPYIGLQPATATVSFDDSVAARPGKPFSLTTTTQVSLGGNTSAGLEVIGAATVSADVTTSLQIGNKAAKATGNSGTQTSPESPDPVVVDASGVTNAVKLGAGTAQVSLTGINLSVRAVDADGYPIVIVPNDGAIDSDGDPNTFDVPCTVAAGESATIGAITVTPHA